MADEKGRDKALQSTLADLTKRFGDGAIVRLGDATHLQVATIPTGSLAVDIALGAGGIPRGESRKSTARKVPARQRSACTPSLRRRARRHLRVHRHGARARPGVRGAHRRGHRQSVHLAAGHRRAALDIAEALVRSGALDVVVLDSVAALVPRAELEGEMGDSHVGLQARLMSQALRKLSARSSSLTRRCCSPTSFVRKSA
jgi:recombination protein RecA